MMQPIEMRPHKCAAHSDLRSDPCPISARVRFVAWTLVLSFCLLLRSRLGWRDYRSDAEFYQRWKAEELRREKQIAEMSRGNANEQRISRILKGGK